MTEANSPTTQVVTKLTGTQARICSDLIVLATMRGKSEAIPAGNFLQAARSTFICPFYRIDRTMYGSGDGPWREDLCVYDEDGRFVFWGQRFAENGVGGMHSYAHVHTHVRDAWEKSVRRGARRIARRLKKSAMEATAQG